MKRWRDVQIRYRDDKNCVRVIRADYCSGIIPAHSRTFYWKFCRGRDDQGKRIEVASVPKKSLMPGVEKVVESLYGRPWLRQVFDAEKIVLRAHPDWLDAIRDLPEDAQQVWSIDGTSDSDVWLIECQGRVILHVLNNDEITKKAETFEEALTKLFPDQPIEIRRVISHIEVTVLDEHLKGHHVAK